MVTVSPAEPADAAAIAELLAELSEFYGAPTAGTPGERARQVSESLFGSPPAACALLARDGDQTAGLAACSFAWPVAGLTRSLYLKELFVAAAGRGQGAGRLLMQAIFDTGAQLGCSRSGPPAPAIPGPGPSTPAWAWSCTRARSSIARTARPAVSG